MRVSRKIQNMLRRARKADPVYRVMSTLRSVQTPQKRQVREAAEALYLELRSRGVTRAACVQAVKTNWVTQLRAKYRP